MQAYNKQEKSKVLHRDSCMHLLQKRLLYFMCPVTISKGIVFFSRTVLLGQNYTRYQLIPLFCSNIRYRDATFKNLR